jgi:hypothetical protein
LTAGFKPSIKMKITGASLTVLSEIKDLALKTETLEGEKKSKPNNPQFQTNPVDDNDQEVDALRYGSNRVGFNNRNFQGGSSQHRGD